MLISSVFFILFCHRLVNVLLTQYDFFLLSSTCLCFIFKNKEREEAGEENEPEEPKRSQHPSEEEEEEPARNEQVLMV